MDLQPVVQRHLQAGGKERNHDVRVNPSLQPVADGADAKLAFQRAEYRFDLCQLYVARSQHGRVFRARWILGGSLPIHQVHVASPLHFLTMIAPSLPQGNPSPAAVELSSPKPNLRCRSARMPHQFRLFPFHE